MSKHFSTLLWSWHKKAVPLREKYNKLSINCSLDTSNKKYQDDLSNFMKDEYENHLSQSKIYIEELLKTYLSLTKDEQEKYETLIAKYQVDNKIISKRHADIQAELENLYIDYDRQRSRLTINIFGDQLSLATASKKYSKSPDRSVRETAWKAVGHANNDSAMFFHNLLTQIYTYKSEMARASNIAPLSEYLRLERHQFDYENSFIYQFFDQCSNALVPLIKEQEKFRKKKLGVTELRPWDLSVNLESKSPIEINSQELADSLECILKQIDQEMVAVFSQIKADKNLDLESRKNKAPGAFCACLEESKSSFIFLNSTGQIHDLIILAHEFGHAFHNHLTYTIEPFQQRDYPTEFAEFASTSLEFLILEHLDSVFPKDICRQIRSDYWHSKVKSILSSASLAKLGLWSVENPNATLEERGESWQQALKAYNPTLKTDGIEKYFLGSWHGLLHLFKAPLYILPYAIAEVGALLFLNSYRNNPEGALKNFKDALSLGGKKNLNGLYTVIGYEFPFSDETLQKAFKVLEKELKEC